MTLDSLIEEKQKRLDELIPQEAQLHEAMNTAEKNRDEAFRNLRIKYEEALSQWAPVYREIEDLKKALTDLKLYV